MERIAEEPTGALVTIYDKDGAVVSSEVVGVKVYRERGRNTLEASNVRIESGQTLTVDLIYPSGPPDFSEPVAITFPSMNPKHWLWDDDGTTGVLAGYRLK